MTDIICLDIICLGSEGPYGYTWFVFPQGRHVRLLGEPGCFYPSEEDEESGLKHFVVNDFGDLVPVFDKRS